MPSDLFALARDNAPRLADQCQETIDSKTGDDRPTIEAFAALVDEDARVGVNMRPSVLALILGGESYLNMNELAEKDSQSGSIGYEQALRKRLGQWYDRRVTFEAEFERGTEFKYGAVNVGTAGALRYQGVCAILKHEALTIVGLLPSDSLQRYVNGSDVGTDRVEAEVGSWDSRCHVAVIKLDGRACRCSPAEWRRLVCSGDDFIEVICVDSFGADEVSHVRITESEEARLRQAVYNTYTGGDPTTNREAHALIEVKGDLRSRGMTLEVVADA